VSNLPPASRLSVGSILAAAAAIAAALDFPVLVPGRTYWVVGLIVVSAWLAFRAHRFSQLRAAEHQRRMAEMSDLQLATIEALALAIAAQQESGDGRLRRVRLYTSGLARVLGMSDTEILGVNAAALLHDIGKLAVPEYLLWKAAPLAPEELRKIRRHPEAGADIVGAVPFPYPVVSIIRSHHERWDGSGYPAGLVGDDIPLGARILSTTDYFDSLMSEPSITADAALERLQHARGHALDPRVVDAFVGAYPALAAQADAKAGPGQSALADRSSTTFESAGSAAVESGPYSKALHEISLAHREIHALYDIAQAMSSSLGVHATMNRLSDTLSALVPLSSCALFVPGDEAGTLGCRFAHGVDVDRIQRLTMRDGQWSTEWVAWSRPPLSHTHSVANSAAGDADERTVLASALMYPLIFNERFVGMLAVYHTDPSIYTDEHARLLGRVCEQAAAAIHHALVFEQTQEDSFRDPLTGLPNARYLFIHLARELARAERMKSSLSLLLLDLDAFKAINDTCGHHIGDKALRTVAAALQSVIRRYDVCVRYAGDEFVVVLSGCGKDEAEQKRLDLQRAIDEVSFEISPGRRLSLSISGGLAVFPHDGVSRDDLLAMADRRMYGDKTRRKRHGVAPLSPR
jgi:diguanylate cyclase (GGDEF)-like protein/putative nucleotidyltransferase with HDIG domain